jgi:arylformamidase
MSMLYDITRTVRPSTAVWPGDSPYQAIPQWQIARGDSVNLVTLTLSPHTGSHADAWFHYEADGAHPAAMPLDAYIGPARVLTVTRRAGPLRAEDFAPGALEGVQRLLVHSHVSSVPDDQWPAEFPWVSPALIAQLAGQGCRLIGLDSPSFDSLDSTDLPGHHALAAHGMVNLECLCLNGVPDGDYELIALPLRLDEACGSPVRAVLRSL